MDAYLENNVRPLVEALEDVLGPTPEEHECFAAAMELYVAHERHGLPEAGGYHDQDALYVHILECVQAARANAEALTRQEEAHRGFQKEQEAEEKAQENQATY